MQQQQQQQQQVAGLMGTSGVLNHPTAAAAHGQHALSASAQATSSSHLVTNMPTTTAAAAGAAPISVHPDDTAGVKRKVKPGAAAGSESGESAPLPYGAQYSAPDEGHPEHKLSKTMPAAAATSRGWQPSVALGNPARGIGQVMRHTNNLQAHCTSAFAG
jgi:hypothetical protein